MNEPVSPELVDELVYAGAWKALRIMSGLSGREIERRLGWKAGYISWIERGARPTAAQASELARLYGAVLRTGLKEVGDDRN